PLPRHKAGNIAGPPYLESKPLKQPADASRRSASIMARYALDGRDHFLIGDILSRADEGRILSVHEDGTAQIRIPSKRPEEAGTLPVVQHSKVHDFAPLTVGDG